MRSVRFVSYHAPDWVQTQATSVPHRTQDGDPAMALDPTASLRKDKTSQTLGTGFTYRPQSEVKGFAFRPEVLSELCDRLEQLDKFRRRPEDASYNLY